MKTISELQQEIRKMQIDLRDMDKHLSEISDELLSYKDSGKNESIYKRIYEIAETLPIIQHPIIKYSNLVKKNYLGILLMIATCEDSINDNQLLLLQRMVMTDSQRKTIDLYVDGIGNILAENVMIKMDENIKEKLSCQLVLDMLLIANLSTVKTKRTFEIIATIASFLKVNSSGLKIISMTALMILTRSCSESLKGLSVNSVETIQNNYGYYLKELSEWQSLLAEKKEQEARRKIEKERKRREEASCLYDFSKKKESYLDNKPWL